MVSWICNTCNDEALYAIAKMFYFYDLNSDHWMVDKVS